jgi:hypothetical protein
MPGEEGKGEGSVFRDTVRKKVSASIGKGIPVHYGSEEDGLITGCSSDGSRWRCLHPYYSWGSEEFWYDEADGFAGGSWPWAVVVWRGPKEPGDLVPEEDLLMGCLGQAVDMWSAGKRGDQYLTGSLAYDFWTGWLESVDEGTAEDPVSGMMGNGWYYDVLIHSRAIAGRWLRLKADEVGGTVGRHLSAAVESYEGMVEVLSEGIECAWSLALPPEKHEDWTSSMRMDQVQRLRTASEKDAEAISAIERALTALR